MQVSETVNEGLKRAYKAVLPQSEVEEKVGARLDDLAKTARLPGFRPGKAPVSVLRQRFGKSLYAEVVQSAVNDAVRDTLSENGVRPAMQPKVDVQSIAPEADVEFTFELEALPDIDPGDLSAIELERPVAEVTDEALDKALRQLADNQRRTEPLEQPRPARTGDVLVIDFDGRIDGAAFAGGSAQGATVELGASGLPPGFDENLVGAEAGARVSFDLTFPEDYVSKEVAGKAATFGVDVKEIRVKVETLIDDDLAKSLGAENLDSLRERVRDQLGREYRAISRRGVKRKLLDVLAERYDFAAPEGMVDLEFEQIWRQIEHAREHGDVDDEDAGKSEDELKADYRDIARRRVRLGLLLSEIGQRNDITVAQDELTRAMVEEARKYPGQEQRVFEFYEHNEQAREALRGPIFEDKVVDFITELAKVTERTVEVDELMRLSMGAEAKADGEAGDAG